MTRITVDVNDGWLEAARVVLGTDTKVATINAALHAQALKAKAAEILAALDSAQMDYGGRTRRPGRTPGPAADVRAGLSRRHFGIRGAGPGF